MTLLGEGQIVRDTYEVERLLGEGAFAEVYRVKHRFLGRQAMKVLKVAGITNRETEEMLSEAILLSRLGHPNIIRVFDANTLMTSKGSRGFFTMEYVPGGSLDQFWRSFGGTFVPIDISIDIAVQICRGLEVAHSSAPPIIHRDIKPQNVLVGYDMGGLRAKVSDFGLAKHVNPLTLLASARGTRCFKAPETFMDAYGDSCAGDMWAMGCMLYLLLTDRLPFNNTSESNSEDLEAFKKPVTLPSEINIRADEHLDEIVGKALAVEPKRRYKNATEMLKDFDKWQPRAKRSTKQMRKDAIAASSKDALGGCTPADEEMGRKMALGAMSIAKEPDKLKDAADLMEEAFNKWPSLRNQYEYQLRLWRSGKSA